MTKKAIVTLTRLTGVRDTETKEFDVFRTHAGYVMISEDNKEQMTVSHEDFRGLADFIEETEHE